METLVIVVLALVAVAVVAWPVLRPPARDAGAEDPAAAEAALDAEVARYREAVRGGTVCPRCLAANPAGSQFCAECGTPVGPDAS
ncbi:MAG TPA: hypothetical protein VMK65_02545 [Longimicrobiales bacterium]|nr:hypothetical protein [Longimicrobiales bacterium]